MGFFNLLILVELLLILAGLSIFNNLAPFDFVDKFLIFLGLFLILVGLLLI